MSLEPRAQCECSRPATVKRGNAYICTRCAKMERGNRRMRHIAHVNTDYYTIGDHRKPRY